MAKPTKTKKRFYYQGDFGFIYTGTEPLVDTEAKPNKRLDRMMKKIGDAMEEAGFEFDYTGLGDPRELKG